MFQPVNPKKPFPQVEHEQLEFWEKNNIFQKSVDQRQGRKKYVFFDGPPFANGLPHYGHILAGSMKDAVTRYWTMKGFYVPRVNGWDCHGLPVEYEIEKELKLTGRKDIEKMGVANFNDACRESVFRYTGEWQKLMKRLARWVDFENEYATLDNSYMESIWWVFQQIWKKKMMYRGFKSMHICPRCQTPLSNFEVSLGYKEVSDLSITVKFPLKNEKNTYLLAWTTTPWTMPAHMFINVGPKIRYVKVRYENEFYILSKDSLEKNFKDKNYEVVEELTAKDLEGREYEPPFDYFKDWKNAFRIYIYPEVSAEEGTGLVHMVPAFGGDEEVAFMKSKDIAPIIHVKMDGTFTDEIRDFAGKSAKAEVFHIKDAIEKKGLLFSSENYRHSYAHCWRCDTPLFNYLTESWFIRVTEIKEQLLKNNRKIHWQPPHIKEGRFGKWLEGVRDWSISRNRFWGCPIPIWECGDRKCGELVCIGSIEELKKYSGDMLPLRDGELDLHKPYIDEVIFSCQKCGKKMHRIPDVLDCWFESGSMPYAQLHYPFENKKEFEDNFPADFIAEGVDQTRGWFYTLHVISAILFNKPAFQNVIVNGIMLAADGEKLSKRKKNYPDPNVLFEKHGVDSTRLFLYTSPAVLGDDVRFSERHVEEIVKQFTLTLWNTYSFFVTYANIDEWDPMREEKEFEKFRPKHSLDQWILSELNTLIATVTTNMDDYNLMAAARPLLGFVDNLSNWYVRRSRRRFWKSENDADKNEAYHTLYFVLLTVSKLIAPFMPFLADELYRNLTGAKESVHLEDWPVPVKKLIKPLLNEEIRIIRQIVNLGHSARAQAGLKVRQPLAKIQVALPESVSPDLVEQHREVILEELNVKEMEFLTEVSTVVKVVVTPNAKILGPKYGKAVQDILRLCREGKFELHDDGSVTVGEWKLRPEEVDIGYRGTDEIGVASGDGFTVLLDLKLTDALMQEGLARDIVRFIQDMRKEAGYDVSDHIYVSAVSDDALLQQTITVFAEYISRETLCDELQQHGDFQWDLEKGFEIEGKKLKIGIRKA